MKKKILLIFPKPSALGYGNLKFISFLINKQGAMLNAGLAVIAALTPKSEFEVRILDEGIEDIDFNTHYDIVGITGYPTQFVRAKKIIREFRNRKTLVVCGGPSVSVSPELWRDLADVLIIGEAERIWPQFIKDYISGSHNPEYRETERFELTNTPIPDYSSIPKHVLNQYICGIVQTSRGCPFNCEFCDVIVYVGRKMRYKPLDRVLGEVEQLYKLGFKVIFLADDNFSAGIKSAKTILRALRDLNMKLKRPMSFATQLSIDIAQDEEFLELAAEAGLNNVHIGVETPNVESLKETGKLQNLQSDIIESIKKFQQHGIMVTTGCIVGFDNDDLSIFQKQFDFLKKAGVPRVRINSLHAPDGTPLKERMIKEGRYVDPTIMPEEELERASTFNTFTIIPKQMSTQQLQQGIFWLYWKLYSPENFAERFKTFLDNFENSPKKDKLRIMKPRPGKPFFGFAWRLLKYYLTDATPEEKQCLKEMIKAARKSSFPLSFGMAMNLFLDLKNSRDLVQVENPNIEQVSYPTAANEKLIG